MTHHHRSDGGYYGGDDEDDREIRDNVQFWMESANIWSTEDAEEALWAVEDALWAIDRRIDDAHTMGHPRARELRREAERLREMLNDVWPDKDVNPEYNRDYARRIARLAQRANSLRDDVEDLGDRHSPGPAFDGGADTGDRGDYIIPRMNHFPERDEARWRLDTLLASIDPKVILKAIIGDAPEDLTVWELEIVDRVVQAQGEYWAIHEVFALEDYPAKIGRWDAYAWVERTPLAKIHDFGPENRPSNGGDRHRELMKYYRRQDIPSYRALPSRGDYFLSEQTERGRGEANGNGDDDDDDYPAARPDGGWSL